MVSIICKICCAPLREGKCWPDEWFGHYSSSLRCSTYSKISRRKSPVYYPAFESSQSGELTCQNGSKIRYCYILWEIQRALGFCLEVSSMWFLSMCEVCFFLLLFLFILFFLSLVHVGLIMIIWKTYETGIWWVVRHSLGSLCGSEVTYSK